MSFFLLGRGPDGDLILLSETAHQNRKDALARLSELTKDPSFGHWDAEVFVLDLEAGTPVLLVRPEPATAEAAEPTEEIVAEEAEPVGDAAIADEIVAEAEVAAEAEEAASLKDALARTAERMESEGIVAPESVGPGEEAAPEAEAEPGEPERETEAASAEVQWPWAAKSAEAGAPEIEIPQEEPVGMAAELVVIDDGSGGLATEEGSEIVLVEVPAEPAEELPEPIAALEVELVEPESVLEEEPPIAEEPAEEAAPEFVLDDLEAPAPEATPLVQGVDDETFELASQPVVLDDEVLRAEEAAPAPEAPGTAPAPGAAAAPASSADDISAFISGLDQVTSIQGAVAEPASVSGSADVAPDSAEAAPEAALDAEPVAEQAPEPVPTCEDCVYDRTCPHRDMQTPQNCGSFQWKSL